MSSNKPIEISEQESRRVAEASRETEWSQPSFLRELFLGNLRFDLIDPFPKPAKPDRPEFNEFFAEFKRFCAEHVDPTAIDMVGEYPPEVIAGLKSLGAFSMKIPTDYGGLGFSQEEYNTVMQWLGSVDANIVALLSAHQSIGVPQPVKLFGTPEQKAKYLKLCAGGAISAFALTEPTVGSDPATLTTTAVLNEAGDSYILNGEKLWCTNGTLADLLVVMATNPETRRISTLIVDTKSPGVSVDHRCHFMGLKALSNAVISFDNVSVPKDNLIGKEGQGLKVALVTLNTGRLTIPAVTLGAAKWCLEICRRWASIRVQWGVPVGKHETIAHDLANMASTTFAMEAIHDLAVRLSDHGKQDIRLEAAAAKEWNSTRGWEIVDRTMQIRGGRGYETESSLEARGEAGIAVERMFRDSRINTVFEGSSEIMHLFMAREAVDKHLQVAGAIIDPKKSFGDKLAAFPKIAMFYAFWYPTRWLGWSMWPRFSEFGKLAKHLRFVDKRTRKLSREVFHSMVVYAAKMERKQAFLFRIVDIGLELFAMSATISRARQLERDKDPTAADALEMADLFCRDARRHIDGLFRALWHNDDAHKTQVSRRVLSGEHAWLESGIQALPFSDEQLQPKVGAGRSARSSAEHEKGAKAHVGPTASA